MNVATTATLNDRTTIKCGGTIGFGWVEVRRTTTAIEITVAAMSPRIPGDVQPHSRPCTMASAKPAVPTPMSSAPSRSGVRAVSSSSLSARTFLPHTSAVIPIGRPNAKAQRHDPYWINAPPTTGPTAVDKANVDPQIATAVPRRSAGHAATARPSDAGAIAATVIEHLIGNDAEARVAALLVRPSCEEKAAFLAPVGCRVLTDIAGVVAMQPDLVAECAGHGAVAEYASAVLDAGIDLAVISTGALADEVLLEDLRSRARQSGAQLLIPAGAVAGVDALAAARTQGIARVVYTSSKPPAAWKGTPAEAACDLDNLTEPFVHFHGDARQAARLYPKNANVAATIALAGAGFEDTEVSLIADPEAGTNIHEIEAQGGFWRLHITVNGATLPENPKTSALAAYSMVRIVFNRGSALVI